MYIPYPLNAERMPIDISFVFRAERPAGRHGFLTVCGDDFRFEDGAPARFFGVNFNGGACFPTHAYARAVARRLAMTGCNLVRFHQLDAEWNTPNIFAFSKGERRRGTLALDEASMERLDYLVACLKDEGVYCYLDMMTYRNFKSDDGVDNPRRLADCARPYGYFNRRLIELQKEYMTQLWTHANPYTGLKYCDDPVFVLTEIVNESDLFGRYHVELEPYASEFRALFADWLTKNGGADASAIDLNGDDPALLRFKVEVQRGFYAEMRAHLRSVGVRVPIAGTNWATRNGNAASQQDNDFCDSHAYFYDWRWGEREHLCASAPLTGSDEIGLKTLLSMRLTGKPFFVSEWDMPWPNAYRAESPLLYAAIGCLQGFAGWAVHTYAYTTAPADVLGKEVTAPMIGGVPYREGVFSTWNDPAKFGLFYHAALMTRRGDASASAHETIVPQGALGAGIPAALEGVAETGRVSVTHNPDEPGELPPKPKDEVTSDTGELYRSWTKRYGFINTPRTQCAYGFLGQNKPVELSALRVECATDFAVVALSSLTDEAIDASDNLLLTAVGRAENTGMVYNGDLLEDAGRAPVRVEVIRCNVSVRTSNPSLKVWAVSAEGLLIGEVPSRYQDGALVFTLGETAPSMYYLLQGE